MSAPAPRRYVSVDVWRIVVDGEPNDAIVGRVQVGDIRVLLHRIDELEAAAAARRPDPADPPHSYAGLRGWNYPRLGDLNPQAGAT